jgi:7-cyano-7-deazaguanine synthase
MNKVVVIFSGGQDSTTCLFWALKRHDSVEAIFFNYGQSHLVELESARNICKRANVRLTEIDISFLNQIVDSALTSNGDVNKLNEKGLPDSFVPNRNQLFITLAHAYAQKIGFNALVTGVCQTDYSGYPDCRKEFIKSIETSSNLGSDSKIEIITPLMYKTKADTFLLAEREGCLAEVVELSHTCYNGDRTTFHAWGYGCDKCPACTLRRKGYEEFLIKYQHINK